MTVADLIELLQQCEEPTTPISVRVWETNGSRLEELEEPVFSRCTVRDVTEQRDIVVIDVEEG